MSEDILDLPPTERSSPWKETVLYIAVGACIYWFISGYLYWPYGLEALMTGCALLLLHTVWSFFSKKGRPIFAYGYFIGKLALICAVFLHLAKAPYAMYFIITASIGFLIGILLLSFKGRKG